MEIQGEDIFIVIIVIVFKSSLLRKEKRLHKAVSKNIRMYTETLWGE